MYLGSVQIISFEIRLITKEISCAVCANMNIHLADA